MTLEMLTNFYDQLLERHPCWGKASFIGQTIETLLINPHKWMPLALFNCLIHPFSV